MAERIKVTYPGAGTVVEFVDDRGRAHKALVTIAHGAGAELEAGDSVNLVYVDQEAGSHDSYGQQLIRQTSVVHESHQPAEGFYWRFPG